MPPRRPPQWLPPVPAAAPSPTPPNLTSAPFQTGKTRAKNGGKQGKTEENREKVGKSEGKAGVEVGFCSETGWKEETEVRDTGEYSVLFLKCSVSKTAVVFWE